MSVDDIKLFAQSEKELKTLLQAVGVYSPDTGVEIGIEKCAMQVMGSGKRHKGRNWTTKLRED